MTDGTLETDTEGEIEKARDRKKKTDKGSPEHSESIVTDGTLETDTEGEIEKARPKRINIHPHKDLCTNAHTSIFTRDKKVATTQMSING